MNTSYKIIRIYENQSGKRPYEEWFKRIDDLSAKDRITMRIDRLAMGLLGDYKSVGKGVFELRVDIGPGYRVYFAIRGRQVIILLCGGDKRTQEKDIKRAQLYAASIAETY